MRKISHLKSCMTIAAMLACASASPGFAQTATAPTASTAATPTTPSSLVATDAATDSISTGVVDIPATADCSGVAGDLLVPGTNGSSSASSADGTDGAGSCSDGMAAAHTNQAAISRASAAQSTLQSAAAHYGLDWRMLAAIGVRETNFTNLNSNDHGWGVFQLTNQPGVTQSNAWSLSFAANYAAKLLQTFSNYVKTNHQNFSATQQLQATAAAYNFGPKNIHGNPNTIDVGTTKGNYGSNVLALMNCF